MARHPTVASTEDTLSEDQVLRYSVSLVTQGKHRFYTLTVPSDVLAQTCFVTDRFEDPEVGFQRMLDKNRAQQIADYIDSGLGTIPSSIVLSAQPTAELKDVGKGKTLEFRASKKAFLIIDGQHRVFGFSLAKEKLRIPVVIYNGLSKRDESRLFIDINTKQRPVPTELLLDIKKLAEYETDSEKLMGEVFDLFSEEPGSVLFGKTAPASKIKGKISRVTFNAAVRPILKVFNQSEAPEVYRILEAYIRSFNEGLSNIATESTLMNPVVFRAVIQLFPEIGARIKDRNLKYTTDNFTTVLKPVMSKLKPGDLKAASPAALFEILAKALRKDFTI